MSVQAVDVEIGKRLLNRSTPLENIKIMIEAFEKFTQITETPKKKQNKEDDSMPMDLTPDKTASNSSNFLPGS